jgi:hypothetical protein
MADSPYDVKARAEARFRKQQDRTREVNQIHADNAAKARAVDVKTAGLKVQRLARDEAERVDAAKKAGVTPPAAKKPSAKRARSIKVKNLNAENDG